MAALNFPSSPSIGSTYIANGKTWTWDGTAWKSTTKIQLDSQVSGTLPTLNGGTGLSSVGDGNSLLGVVGAGTTLEYKTLTSGSGITITYSSGFINFDTTGSAMISGSGTTGTIALFQDDNTIGDSLITQTGTMVQVAGSFKALTKSFKIPHPIDPTNKILEHGSLEGPEHGAYQRGTASGIGDVSIYLPDYWPYLVEENYTVHLTSRGNYNLFVKNQSADHFTVAKTGEIDNTTISFDYFIIGERKDTKIEVVQIKNKETKFTSKK
jgi:hypothetical protein